MRAFLKRYWFLIGLLVAVALGFALPGFARRIDPEQRIIRVTTVLLFWIAGLTLPAESIRRGLANVRLHALVQGMCFVVIPAYFWATARWFSGHLDGQLVVGLYALAVLPTTIAMCVVFTQSAGGNTFGALFNSALANLAGVLVSPLLLSIFLRGSGAMPAVGELFRIVLGLLWIMMLPVGVGQITRRIRPTLAAPRARWATISSLFILSTVFLTFSRSAENPALLGRLASLAVPAAYLAASHVLFLFASYGAAQLLRLPLEDRICAVFAAPQKSMAMGVPLLTVYFAHVPELLGIALIPLLIYHPWQLLMAGVVRSWVLRKTGG